MTSAFIISAKRSANGRIGGLHKSRRLLDLAAPIVAAALADARLEAARVDELIVGNASEGGNPARLIALAAGLPEKSSAITLDRQCASGLDAILSAIRTIAAGAASVIVAGGAESLSTAPWRVSRPRNPAHPPRFIAIGADGGSEEHGADRFAAFDQAAAKLGLGRDAQDDAAFLSFGRALAAREAGTFLGEIVPLRHNAEEARDQPSIEIDRADLSDETPFAPPTGTATPANSSVLCDGAAFVVVVSDAVWRQLGSPRALRLVACASMGVGPGNEAEAASAAALKLFSEQPAHAPLSVTAVELNERTASEALAVGRAFGFAEGILNPDGGAVARGHPFGAAGAVLVARLFTRMVRATQAPPAATGLAMLGAFGGQGLAALFQRVDAGA